MSRRAQLADGTTLEFPDDTQDSVIDRTVKNHLQESNRYANLPGLRAPGPPEMAALSTQPPAPEAPPEQPGMIDRGMQALHQVGQNQQDFGPLARGAAGLGEGLLGQVQVPLDLAKTYLQHPVGAERAIGEKFISQPMEAEYQKAFEPTSTPGWSGESYERAARLITGSIPVVGPTLGWLLDDVKSGNYAGLVGKLISLKLGPVEAVKLMLKVKAVTPHPVEEVGVPKPAISNLQEMAAKGREKFGRGAVGGPPENPELTVGGVPNRGPRMTSPPVSPEDLPTQGPVFPELKQRILGNFKNSFIAKGVDPAHAETATWLFEKMADSLQRRAGIDIYDKVDTQAGAEGEGLGQASSGGDVRGDTLRNSALDGGKTIIRALESPNFSTMVHETFHAFHDYLPERDLAVLGKWAGVEGGAWETVHYEKVARAFEKYLQEGNAPHPSLVVPFARMKEWMLQIYTRLGEQDLLPARLSPKVRETFDTLIHYEGPEALQQGAGKRGPAIGSRYMIHRPIPDYMENIAKELEKGGPEQPGHLIPGENLKGNNRNVVGIAGAISRKDALGLSAADFPERPARIAAGIRRGAGNPIYERVKAALESARPDVGEEKPWEFNPENYEKGPLKQTGLPTVAQLKARIESRRLADKIYEHEYKPALEREEWAQKNGRDVEPHTKAREAAWKNYTDALQKRERLMQEGKPPSAISAKEMADRALEWYKMGITLPKGMRLPGGRVLTEDTKFTKDIYEATLREIASSRGMYVKPVPPAEAAGHIPGMPSEAEAQAAATPQMPETFTELNKKLTDQAARKAQIAEARKLAAARREGKVTPTGAPAPPEPEIARPHLPEPEPVPPPEPAKMTPRKAYGLAEKESDLPPYEQDYRRRMEGVYKELKRLSRLWQYDPSDPSLVADEAQLKRDAAGIEEMYKNEKAEYEEKTRGSRRVVKKPKGPGPEPEVPTTSSTTFSGDMKPRLRQVGKGRRPPLPKPTLMDKIIEARNSGLLALPSVWGKKAMSDAYLQVEQFPLKAISATLEKSRIPQSIEFAAHLGKEPFRKTISRFYSDLPAAGKGMWRGVPDALKEGLDALLERAQSPLSQHVNNPAIGGMGGRIIRSVGMGPIRGIDAIAKRLTESTEKRVWANRLAEMQGMRGATKKMFVDRMAAQDFFSLAPHIQEEIMPIVQERTFTAKMGELASTIDKVRLGFHGLGRFLIPFYHIGVNIGKQVGKRTPLYVGQVIRKVAKGELKGPQISDELAKPIMGTAILATLYGAYKAGKLEIHGAGPAKKQEQYNRESFRLPNSVTAGGVQVGVKPLEPVGGLITLLGTAIDLVEDKDTIAKKTHPKQEVFQRLWNGVMDAMTSRTLDEFGDIAEMLKEPTGNWERFVGNELGSLVPRIVAKAAAARDRNAAREENVRKVQSVGDYIKRDIPGLRETLPPVLSRTGTPVTRDISAGERMLSPFLTMHAHPEKTVEKELDRLGIIPPGGPIEMSTKKYGSPKELTQEQSAKVLRRNAVATEKLVKTITSPEYQARTDEKKRIKLLRTYGLKRRKGYREVVKELKNPPPEEP